jgi:SAM-dependent methyltransferase
MTLAEPRVVIDQELFFNLLAKRRRSREGKRHDIFYRYTTKEQVDGFRWLKDRKRILDYGCGIGRGIDLYLEATRNHDIELIGVDIAGVALMQARRKHPEYSFYEVHDNKIPRLKDASVDAAYLIYVLHHSQCHQEIFDEIYRILEGDGKLLIVDLTSKNPFLLLARKIFPFLPEGIRNMFSDDLVVEGRIPEKYAVSVPLVAKQLGSSGFVIEEIGYGLLFFFIFAYFDRLLRLPRTRYYEAFLKVMLRLEELVLEFDWMRVVCEIFCVKCTKKATVMRKSI